MNDLERNELFNDVFELLDIYKEFSPVSETGTVIIETVKPCILEMIKYIMKNEEQEQALVEFLDKSDFWTAPASSKFHGNFKAGLSLHTLLVIKQSLVFSKSVLENYFSSPNGQQFSLTAKDIFLAALCHDFCKIGFYGVEYRNVKDNISGNWTRQPYYKTKSDNRNLGHGNESVLIMLQVLPELISNRTVIEAVSRHMGFSDLSESEGYNYSNFLQNPLVLLLQLADQTAAAWYNA